MTEPGERTIPLCNGCGRALSLSEKGTFCSECALTVGAEDKLRVFLRHGDGIIDRARGSFRRKRVEQLGVEDQQSSRLQFVALRTPSFGTTHLRLMRITKGGLFVRLANNASVRSSHPIEDFTRVIIEDSSKLIDKGLAKQEKKIKKSQEASSSSSPADTESEKRVCAEDLCCFTVVRRDLEDLAITTVKEVLMPFLDAIWEFKPSIQVLYRNEFGTEGPNNKSVNYPQILVKRLRDGVVDRTFALKTITKASVDGDVWSKILGEIVNEYCSCLEDRLQDVRQIIGSLASQKPDVIRQGFAELMKFGNMKADSGNVTDSKAIVLADDDPVSLTALLVFCTLVEGIPFEDFYTAMDDDVVRWCVAFIPRMPCMISCLSPDAGSPRERLKQQGTAVSLCTIESILAKLVQQCKSEEQAGAVYLIVVDFLVAASQLAGERSSKISRVAVRSWDAYVNGVRAASIADNFIGLLVESEIFASNSSNLAELRLCHTSEHLGAAPPPPPDATVMELLAPADGDVRLCQDSGITELLNDGPYVVSLKASYCMKPIPGRPTRWAFEMIVFTPGIIHVGILVSDSSTKGLQRGIGLSLGSWAYDGSCQVKWHKQKNPAVSPEEHYGEAWKPGDVVTVLFDGKSGELVFMLNGKSLGVAYTLVQSTREREISPAISLAMHQACSLNFGTMPFEIPPPPGFVPVAVALSEDYKPEEEENQQSAPTTSDAAKTTIPTADTTIATTSTTTTTTTPQKDEPDDSKDEHMVVQVSENPEEEASKDMNKEGEKEEAKEIGVKDSKAPTEVMEAEVKPEAVAPEKKDPEAKEEKSLPENPKEETVAEPKGPEPKDEQPKEPAVKPEVKEEAAVQEQPKQPEVQKEEAVSETVAPDQPKQSEELELKEESVVAEEPKEPGTTQTITPEKPKEPEVKEETVSVVPEQPKQPEVKEEVVAAEKPQEPEAAQSTSPEKPQVTEETASAVPEQPKQPGVKEEAVAEVEPQEPETKEDVVASALGAKEEAVPPEESKEDTLEQAVLAEQPKEPEVVPEQQELKKEIAVVTEEPKEPEVQQAKDASPEDSVIVSKEPFTEKYEKQPEEVKEPEPSNEPSNETPAPIVKEDEHPPFSTSDAGVNAEEQTQDFGDDFGFVDTSQFVVGDDDFNMDNVDGAIVSEVSVIGINGEEDMPPAPMVNDSSVLDDELAEAQRLKQQSDKQHM